MHRSSAPTTVRSCPTCATPGEGYYDKNNEEDAAAPAVDVNSGECIVAKNRHGEMNTVKLHWQGEFMRFTDVETRYD